jgi:DDE superfamily endonuclease
MGPDLSSTRARGVRICHRALGRLAIEWLPGYAPELNPVEYIWGYWKHHELPNFCPRDFGELSHQAPPAPSAVVLAPSRIVTMICRFQ